MPIYMKIEGIVGPLTYNNSKGWIELLSVQLGHGKSGEEGDVFVTKSPDSTSTALFRSFEGKGKKVTIVFVKDGCEYLRIKLGNTLISSYSSTGSDGLSPMESLSLNYTDITYENGSSSLFSLMLRPQDWGCVKARAEFNRSAKGESSLH